MNYIERHNFGWNDFLTKSDRTKIQTYKVEERTFGTPCMANNIKAVPRPDIKFDVALVESCWSEIDAGLSKK